jgi:hypothetical protein
MLNGPPSPTSAALETRNRLVCDPRASGDYQLSARFEKRPAQCGKLTWRPGTAAQNRIECRSQLGLCAKGFIRPQRNHSRVLQSELSDDRRQK